MPPINFTGLASGLDTRALIDAIIQAERKPIERLEARQGLLNQRRSAFDELRSKLKTLESSLTDLASPRTFRGRIATVSDDSILRASASVGAETGTFELEVTALAKAHKLRSDSLAASDQGLVTDGTITIQSGTKDRIVVEVSVANGNNSLQAIRDAINAADAGVDAAVIFDGTGYLLTVRASETGIANGLSITDSTNLALTDPGNEVTAAGDAKINVDGIAITSASNKIQKVIPGVTIDLLTTNVGAPITVDVTQDQDRVIEGVEGLVAKFNDVIDFFDKQADRDKPGVLASDPTARGILSRLQSRFTAGLDSLPLGGIRALASVGVSFDGRTGKATVDSAELRELLDERFTEVGDLFLSSARSTSPRVQYVAGTSATVEGEYAINISQAAGLASVLGSQSVDALASEENLTVTVGGKSATVRLTAGSSLSQVVETLNAALRDAGVQATAADDAGSLRLSSRAYGTGATIEVTSDLADPQNGTQSGFGTTASTGTGVDVAGTIGGAAATGAGQTLTAGADGDADGLVLRITATAAEVLSASGDFGTVSYSRGLVDTIRSQVSEFTRSRSGTIELTRENLSETLERIDLDIERIEERLARREARLLKTFSAAERAISALQAQQSQVNRGF